LGKKPFSGSPIPAIASAGNLASVPSSLKKGATMVVTVKVFASLRSHLQASDRQIDHEKWRVDDGATVGEVIHLLNIPEKLIAKIIVNNVHADQERILKAEDVIHVFPLIAGG
jgi:molybdopterin converting factor small subunit